MSTANTHTAQPDAFGATVVEATAAPAPSILRRRGGRRSSPLAGRARPMAAPSGVAVYRTQVPSITPPSVIRLMERVAPHVLRTTKEADLTAIRDAIDRVAAFQPSPRRVKVRAGVVNGVNGEWLIPPGNVSANVILYLHGGGYVSGSPATHRLIAGSLARRAQIRTFVAEYRIAPEAPNPAQLDDAMATFRRLREVHGAERVAVVGDSAGGGLAVRLCLALRDAGEAQPGAVGLISPWVDLSGPSQGEELERGRSDIVMTAPQIRAMAELYAGDHRDAPEVSPVFADLRGLPPMFIQVGDSELIGTQGEHLAARAHAAGVSTELQVWEHMQHVFPAIFILPERRRALDDLAGFLRRRLN